MRIQQLIRYGSVILAGISDFSHTGDTSRLPGRAGGG